jgi:hypothetical protein
MGNKESRIGDTSTGHLRPGSSGGNGPVSPTERQPVYSSRPGRSSRPDLSFLGIGSNSHHEPAPEGRRETKQEREARKAEKERVARVKERERSIKEEHVDGGFLVTMGVYTGAEDFSKPVVRQLMVCLFPISVQSAGLEWTNMFQSDPPLDRATNRTLLEGSRRL